MSRIDKRIRLCYVCLALAPLLMSGCSHLTEAGRAKAAFEQADGLFDKGLYHESLSQYEQVLEKYPTRGDLALFEMGIILSHPKNERRDLAKAVECFQRILSSYPASSYRPDSEKMIFYINNVPLKDETIATQRARIDALQKEAADRENEIARLQQKISELDQQRAAYALKHRPIDRILVEKKQRRLALLSKGEVLKTYRIALGGDPVGPKQRYDDNKTPEGTYVIDARNKNSRYHLALHISYPNEKDRQRARKLGVSAGGNIMIHGLKNGFSWVGDMPAGVDWTKGCIAVTDADIEEIEKLVPNGTVVEITP